MSQTKEKLIQLAVLNFCCLSSIESPAPAAGGFSETLKFRSFTPKAKRPIAPTKETITGKLMVIVVCPSCHIRRSPETETLPFAAPCSDSAVPVLQIDLGCSANYYRSQRCPRNHWLDNFWATIVSWTKLERAEWAWSIALTTNALSATSR